MKRLILVVLVAILLLFSLIKRQDLEAYYSSFTTRTYRHFSDINLLSFQGGVRARLDKLQDSRSYLQGSTSPSDVEQLLTIEEEMIYLEQVDKQIKTEIKAREFIDNTSLWWRLGLAALIPLAFLSLLALLYTFIPKGSGKAEKEYTQPRLNEQYSDYPAQESVRQKPAPFDNRIVKGSTPKQEVLRILGQPNHRVIFTDLEAWSYLYRIPGQSLDDHNPALPPRLKSVIIIFRGNIVFDFSEEILLHDREPSQIY